MAGLEGLGVPLGEEVEGDLGEGEEEVEMEEEVDDAGDSTGQDSSRRKRRRVMHPSSLGNLQPWTCSNADCLVQNGQVQNGQRVTACRWCQTPRDKPPSKAAKRREKAKDRVSAICFYDGRPGSQQPEKVTLKAAHNYRVQLDNIKYNLQAIKAGELLGCSSLHVLGGVILGNHESTHPEEYAAQAQRGIYKRITHDKAVFAVVDGVGPLANALSADSRFAPQVSRALMHLVNTLKDAVMGGDAAAAAGNPAAATHPSADTPVTEPGAGVQAAAAAGNPAAATHPSADTPVTEPGAGVQAAAAPGATAAAAGTEGRTPAEVGPEGDAPPAGGEPSQDRNPAAASAPAAAGAGQGAAADGAGQAAATATAAAAAPMGQPVPPAGGQHAALHAEAAAATAAAAAALAGFEAFEQSEAAEAVAAAALRGQPTAPTTGQHSQMPNPAAAAAAAGVSAERGAATAAPRGPMGPPAPPAGGQFAVPNPLAASIAAAAAAGAQGTAAHAAAAAAAGVVSGAAGKAAGKPAGKAPRKPRASRKKQVAAAAAVDVATAVQFGMMLAAQQYGTSHAAAPPGSYAPPAAFGNQPSADLAAAAAAALTNAAAGGFPAPVGMGGFVAGAQPAAMAAAAASVSGLAGAGAAACPQGWVPVGLPPGAAAPAGAAFQGFPPGSAAQQQPAAVQDPVVTAAISNAKALLMADGYTVLGLTSQPEFRDMQGLQTTAQLLCMAAGTQYALLVAKQTQPLPLPATYSVAAVAFDSVTGVVLGFQFSVV